MIDIDFTLGIQAINFFVMLWFLNRFVFKPVLKHVDERELKFKEMDERAHLSAKKLDDATAEYDNKIIAIRHESAEITASARKEAQESAVLLHEKARAQVKKEIDQATQEIGDEVERASAKLSKDVKSLAGSLAEKILGRSV
ncbi:hypothetical protein MNBD_NITROSPINAE04-1876 [hydrothermal vent metagenome]|uniref:ATP synthase F0 sector subunit b n=1 Tax=hydrothermal vent metagenome TaxID=652676 RepID=A0A3B1CBW2_9ZZZZ